MNAKELITFKNEIIGELRGFIKDGEPWFLAGQVCRCLGIKNTSDVISQIKRDYKNVGIGDVVSNYTSLLDANHHAQKIIIIPENTLYELIFRSRKKIAVLFRHWVTSEVLPSLRKHGEYRMSTKMFTKDLNETIKNQVVDNSTNENEKRFAYSNFHKLINKSLGLPPKNDRDIMSNEELEQVARRENLVNALLLEGKNYSEIKTIVSNF